MVPAGSTGAPSWPSSQPPNSQSTLSGLVHEVGGELSPQGMPASAGLRFKPREPLRFLPPAARLTGAHAPRRILRRGQHESVSGHGVPLSRLLQGGERLGGYRRPVLVARLLVLCAPPHHSAFHVDVRPSKLADGADAVPRLVREHERDTKPPVDRAGHLEKAPGIPPQKRTTRTGFFSVGVFRPLSGVSSRGAVRPARPSTSRPS